MIIKHVVKKFLKHNYVLMILKTTITNLNNHLDNYEGFNCVYEYNNI